MDQATVALVIPEVKKWGEKEKLWGPLPETLTVTELLLPDVLLYRLAPKEEVLTKPRWRTTIYLVSAESVYFNAMENVSEEIKKFVLNHHRGYRKEVMMKHFRRWKRAKKRTSRRSGSRKSETGKRNSRGERRTSDESRSISEDPSESTLPFCNDPYTTVDYNNLVANLYLEEVEPLEAPSATSETPNTQKLLSHVSVPLDSITNERDGWNSVTYTHARSLLQKKIWNKLVGLLLNQIDRLQKMELKEKWKSMVYLDEYDGEDGTYDVSK